MSRGLSSQALPAAEMARSEVKTGAQFWCLKPVLGANLSLQQVNRQASVGFVEEICEYRETAHAVDGWLCVQSGANQSPGQKLRFQGKIQGKYGNDGLGEVRESPKCCVGGFFVANPRSHNREALLAITGKKLKVTGKINSRSEA